MKFAILKKVAYILTVLLSFLFINKTLRLINLKTRAAMNAKMSLFVICVEAIIYLLLYNLHDCTFNNHVNNTVSSSRKTQTKNFNSN